MADALILSMSGGELPAPGIADPDVVRFLSETLEAAKSGEIVGVAMACLHADQSTSADAQGWLKLALLGSLYALSIRIAERVD